jgi:hypothetical protein
MSFDHLVGEREQIRRHGEAERFRRLEIDVQFEFRGLNVLGRSPTAPPRVVEPSVLRSGASRTRARQRLRERRSWLPGGQIVPAPQQIPTCLLI